MSTIPKDLRQTKKIAVFCAIFFAVVVCTILLMKTVAAKNQAQVVPDTSSAKQEDGNNGIPCFTREISGEPEGTNEDISQDEPGNESLLANECRLSNDVATDESAECDPIVYENTAYGFCFNLPITWKGFSVVEEQWNGINNGEIVETGPKLLIRHPDWTEEAPRQDIPIMIFTPGQWDGLQNGNFSVGAAPVTPSKLGCNSEYVFALPARYNYAFQTGFEEVEEILKGNPLWTPGDINQPEEFNEEKKIETETDIKLDDKTVIIEQSYD